jgi:hypothetical protein
VGIESVEQIEPCAWLRVDAHDTSIINHHRRELVVSCDVRSRVALAAEPGGGGSVHVARSTKKVSTVHFDARRVYWSLSRHLSVSPLIIILLLFLRQSLGGFGEYL